MDKLTLILAIIFFIIALCTLVSAIFGNCTFFAPFFCGVTSIGLFLGYKKSLEY